MAAVMSLQPPEGLAPEHTPMVGNACHTFGHCSWEFGGKLDPMLPLAPGVARPQTARLALGNVDVGAGRVLAKIA